MKYIRGIDGLRAISILFVLLTHLGFYSYIKGIPLLEKSFNLYSGASGVMIFFTISGFLITSLLLSEKISNGSINFKNFFIRRFLRLFPPLLIFFTILFFLMVFHLLPQNYVALLLSFFYLYNFTPFQYYTRELGHTWSLGVEEQFYFLWPFIINRIQKIKKGLLLCAIIILVCTIWNHLSHLSISFKEKEYYLSSYFYIERWFIPACMPIIIGAMTSLILFNYNSLLQALFHNNVLFPIISLLLYLAQLYIPHFPLLISIFQPFGVSVFLVWIYFNPQKSLVNLLELKPILFLGKISYGIYVYQGLFLRNAPGGEMIIQHFPLNICLVFITAIVSYFLVEKKVMKYKKKFKSGNAQKEEFSN